MKVDLTEPVIQMNNFCFVISELQNLDEVKGKIVIVERGECTFVDKARKAQAAKAVAVIVIDNVVGSTSTDSPMFAMSGDGISDVTIPVVFVFQKDAEALHAAIKNNTDLEVRFRSSDRLSQFCD